MAPVVKRVAVVLTPPQKAHVEWAERRMEGDSLQMSPLGCYVKADRDTLDKLKFLLTVQLPQKMAKYHLYGADSAGRESSMAAARRAYDKIEAACEPYIADSLDDLIDPIDEMEDPTDTYGWTP